MVRESADLLYNLTVLWASAGVKPEDVWREMERREDMIGIAEKLPKSAVKKPKVLASKALPAKALPKELSKATASAANCRAGRPLLTKTALNLPKFRRLPAWTNPLHDG